MALNCVHPRQLRKKPYDMLELLKMVVDEGYFLEVHQHYAKNIIVGFARFNGRSVGDCR